MYMSMECLLFVTCLDHVWKTMILCSFYLHFKTSLSSQFFKNNPTLTRADVEFWDNFRISKIHTSADEILIELDIIDHLRLVNSEKEGEISVKHQAANSIYERKDKWLISFFLNLNKYYKTNKKNYITICWNICHYFYFAPKKKFVMDTKY